MCLILKIVFIYSHILYIIFQNPYILVISRFQRLISAHVWVTQNARRHRVYKIFVS